MFGKILVANRGEIAIRAYRAARELGARTVAVYPVEDRHSTHRAAADESRQIGEPGHPVQAYLSIDEIIAAARATGADAIYPGYGFLAENAEFAGACAKAGITFIGPSPEALVLAGDKVRAVAAAREAGLPVLASSASITDPAELPAAASGMTFPLFVKAVGGGGGRGMRRVERPAELPSAFAVASREAAAAFGNPAVFLEQAVCQPRHVEVQILADGHGDVVHLFERDCSLQRRHQKVIEMAPAPDLPAELRDRICADAVAFAHQIGYEGAGTVEFLLDAAGNHVFIEMNPRIQVEHTVTEEVTGIDLVRAQLRIAAGETLADLGLKQDSITISGAALQCRVTTEDPAHDFRPSTGRVGAYRPAGGPGVRIDSATCLGAEVTAHFDSLLAKVTCRAENRAGAIVRARRALAEFEVGGVTTNIGFLRAVLADPDFLAGRVHTGFLEEHPDLLTGSATIPDTGDRIGGLLRYLLSVTINRPHGPAPVTTNPREKLPPLDLSQLPVPGSRERLRRLGPARFAAALREQAALAVTDTTFRDAHQSLLATRVRTAELLDVAGHVARLAPELLSVEAWGGATYDVALRFLHEDPWDRLAALREAIPNICLQMLLRGRNTVGYTPYPPLVTSAFIDEAVRAGIDIFRVFDALNNVAQMRPAIDAIRETGVAVAEVALCYTGDLGDPDEHLYTLDYYLRLAEQIVDAGAHVLAIKDMAGLLRPPAAARLVAALRERFDLPVHVHTHDTAGGQLATYLAAWQAGADAVDGASAALAGTTSQPALSAIVAAAAHTDRDTGLSLAALTGLEPYWAALREVYAPFEAGLRAPTGRVYHHEIPGGQLSNLRTQAVALGLGDRFEQVEACYAAADRILGRLVKVTPSSKVVGDLALHLAGAQIAPDLFAEYPQRYDLPDSVIGFLRGDLGTPPGEWPEPFRTRALADRRETTRDAELGAEDVRRLATPGRQRRDTLNTLLFPGPAADYEQHRHTYGDTSALSADQFFYGLRTGQEQRVRLDAHTDLLVRVIAISDPDDRGRRTAVCAVDGQLRVLDVEDRCTPATTTSAEKGDPYDPHQVTAPFRGMVTLLVNIGDEVTAGQAIATIEAMKMQAAITAPVDGIVSRLAVPRAADVSGGDLLVVLADHVPSEETSPEEKEHS